MQTRALVKERAVRNLLLVIDGRKTDAMLLAQVAGIEPGHFVALQHLGLIAPVDGAAARVATPAMPPTAPVEARPLVPSAVTGVLDYAQFTAVLTEIISRELGLRGFMLTLAVEKVSTPQELQDVARRTLAQVGERKGAAAEAAARRLLYGA